MELKEPLIDRPSTYYHFVYDKNTVLISLGKFLEDNRKRFALTRDNTIRSVHSSLGIKGNMKASRNQRLEQAISELSPDVAQWMKDSFGIGARDISVNRLIFVSPTMAYPPNIISSYSVASGCTRMQEVLDQAREELKDEFLDPNIIDDPVWCMWSDIIDRLAH